MMSIHLLHHIPTLYENDTGQLRKLNYMPLEPALSSKPAFRCSAKLSFLALIAISLSACASYDKKTGLYARPTGGAPATHNLSLYGNALTCQMVMAQRFGVKSPRVAVGRIEDLTGKSDFDTGANITRGANLYAMTALGRAGFKVVERFDTAISDNEIAYAKEKILSDAPEMAGKSSDNYRRVLIGQIAGSDYYIVGGVTELNFNIVSSGIDAKGGAVNDKDPKGTFEARSFVMNVGVDLRLVNTRSQEVVDMASYQKQIIGKEIRLGVFDFLNGNIFDISGGKSSHEPVHAAVRSLIERGVFEFGETLYGFNAEACLTPGKDPIQLAQSIPHLVRSASALPASAPSLLTGPIVDTTAQAAETEQPHRPHYTRYGLYGRYTLQSMGPVQPHQMEQPVTAQPAQSYPAPALAPATGNYSATASAPITLPSQSVGQAQALPGAEAPIQGLQTQTSGIESTITKPDAAKIYRRRQ
ncbi:MAG: holdfast anchoring protein HfaB [Asticcacaulis sp.]